VKVAAELSLASPLGVEVSPWLVLIIWSTLYSCGPTPRGKVRRDNLFLPS
jgi:hypothetical protein